MILLAIILFLLALSALVPPFIVLLGQFPGSVPSKFEAFISAYDGTIISLGTLFLVSSLALWTTHLSNCSFEKRERANRKIQSELKIAEFRQEWIENLREDLSEFAKLVFYRDGLGDVSRVMYLQSKIKLRLNPREPLAKRLNVAMSEAFLASTNKDREIGMQKLSDLERASYDFLKAEWDRLKEDIQKAQLLQEVPQ